MLQLCILLRVCAEHRGDNQLNLVHVIDNCYQFENKGKLDFSYSRSSLYSKQGLTLQTGANIETVGKGVEDLQHQAN